MHLRTTTGVSNSYFVRDAFAHNYWCKQQLFCSWCICAQRWCKQQLFCSWCICAQLPVLTTVQISNWAGTLAIVCRKISMEGGYRNLYTVCIYEWKYCRCGAIVMEFCGCNFTHDIFFVSWCLRWRGVERLACGHFSMRDATLTNIMSWGRQSESWFCYSRVKGEWC